MEKPNTCNDKAKTPKHADTCYLHRDARSRLFGCKACERRIWTVREGDRIMELIR
jgi:hypothetical protein